MAVDVEAVVKNNIMVSKDTFAIWFYAPAIAKIALPGQFVMVAVSGKFLRRPISIAGVQDGKIMLIVRVVGEGTKIICDAARNDKFSIFGPLGNGFPDICNRSILVGGGIGIAPLLFAAQKWADKIDALLYGERTADYVISRDLLPEVTKIATDDGSMGFHGFVSDLLYAQKPMSVFACGPMEMLRKIAFFALEKDIPAWFSMESHMACGFGVCQGCVIPTRNGFKRVCADGAVFQADTLIFGKKDL